MHSQVVVVQGVMAIMGTAALELAPIVAATAFKVVQARNTQPTQEALRLDLAAAEVVLRQVIAIKQVVPEVSMELELVALGLRAPTRMDQVKPALRA